MKSARTCRLLTAKLLTLGLCQQLAFAQASTHQVSAAKGAYSAEQAQQGKAIYQNQCAMCHGSSLEGQGQSPPLAGIEFVNKWSGQTVGDLFAKTIVMMPAMSPGTLTPNDTAKVIAYILSANKFPAGTMELPSDPRSLEMISIEKQ